MYLKNIILKVGNAELPVIIHEPSPDNLATAVIICHGFRGSIDGGGRAVVLAKKMAEFGFTAIRFAFTPLKSLSHQVDELKVVVDYCRRNICDKIVLLGRSMGGSCSLAFSVQDKQVAGLCLWATPHNLDETFRLSLGEKYSQLKAGRTIEIIDEYGKLELNPSFLEDFKYYDLLTYINKIKIPVLIIHGDHDRVVPLHQAKEMWNFANEPKQLAIIKGGDHHLANQADLVTSIVLEWLKHHFY